MEEESKPARKPSPGFSQARVTAGDDEADLHRKVVEMLGADGDLWLDSHTRGAICRSFGAECDDEGLPRFPWGSAGEGAENWQLLSPVQSRTGGVVGLNELVRRTWRGTDVQLARHGATRQIEANLVIMKNAASKLCRSHVCCSPS